MRLRRWWTVCLHRLATANAGDGIGWMWRGTRKMMCAGWIPKFRGYMPFNGAYVYRDWVIKAFNDDLPYDKFVRYQLAGDLSGREGSEGSSSRDRVSRWRTVAMGSGRARAGASG